MRNQSYAHNAYTQTKISTAVKPVDIVIMLYEGAIEFLERSVSAISMKEVQVKLKYVDKTLAIIQELLTSLNMELGGEVALNLKAIYIYMLREIAIANAKNDIEKLKHVISLLKTVKEGWTAIRDKV